MSGHSKWSTIKRQKGAADAKRGVAFSKLATAVLLAAKRGGGNAETNFELKMAIDKARASNMPKENIERAIKKGTGELGGAIFEEVMYEAIGPEGIGILVEAATDNRNRTTPEVKNTLTKYGAKFAASGAVSYQFTKKGRIIIDTLQKDVEELELAIIDSGAEDFTEQEEEMVVFTKPNEMESVKKALETHGYSIKEASLSWEPNSLIMVKEGESSQKIITLIEALEELDDVSAVYTNFEIA